MSGGLAPDSTVLQQIHEARRLGSCGCRCVIADETALTLTRDTRSVTSVHRQQIFADQGEHR